MSISSRIFSSFVICAIIPRALSSSNTLMPISDTSRFFRADGKKTPSATIQITEGGKSAVPPLFTVSSQKRPHRVHSQSDEYPRAVTGAAGAAYWGKPVPPCGSKMYFTMRPHPLPPTGDSLRRTDTATSSYRSHWLDYTRSRIESQVFSFIFYIEQIYILVPNLFITHPFPLHLSFVFLHPVCFSVNFPFLSMIITLPAKRFSSLFFLLKRVCVPYPKTTPWYSQQKVLA